MNGVMWVVHVACVTERKVHRGFWFGNVKEKREFGRPYCRWEDNESRILMKYNVRALC
jgi:hypothetical protein